MIYNKLVRDKIPEIILNNNEEPITRVLDDSEYIKYLLLKLNEEVLEVVESCGEDRLEELADLLELIRCIALVEGKSLDDIIKIADDKNKKRGSFKNKIFLERVLTK